jgi:acetylxylan esterase
MMFTVVAAVMFGDPRWRTGMPFNKGTSVKNGVCSLNARTPGFMLTSFTKMFPRPKDITCAPYTSRMISFCDTGDKFCDSGDSVQVHASYLGKYSSQAASFVEQKVKQLTIPVRGN